MKNKLVRTLALGLGTLLCAGALSSCGNSNDYNYELSEYVKVGEYKGLTLSTSAVEESVNSTIDKLLSDNAETKDVTDRAVKSGDKVNIDYAGTIDGEAFTGGTAASQELTLNGASGYIDGFEDGILGMEIGETKTIDVTFPEDYSNTEVAGKAAKFAITLNSATETITPELTDEFLTGLEKGYTTVDAYKADVTENAKKNLLWNQVVAASTVISYPKKETKNYYDNMVSTYEQMAAYYGVTFSSYITSYMGSDVDTFFEQVTTSAKNYVKNDMVLYSIVRTENITVSDADYQKYGEKYALNYGLEDLAAYEEKYGKDEVERSALSEVVGDWLLANCVEGE